MKLIVGLGNPGKSYEKTRHNLGFLVVYALANQFQIKLRPCSFIKGICGEFKFEDEDVCFLLPLSYMNNSGVIIKRFLELREFSYDNILVICDDFNLDFGQIRIRKKGSDGGHNGLKSIIYHLQTKDFARLRMGVGCVPKKKNSSDFVLEDFNSNEQKNLENFIDNAIECCIIWLKGEIKKAMEKYNRRKENGKN